MGSVRGEESSKVGQIEGERERGREKDGERGRGGGGGERGRKGERVR
jgi:hypothetical protein